MIFGENQTRCSLCEPFWVLGRLCAGVKQRTGSVSGYLFAVAMPEGNDDKRKQLEPVLCHDLICMNVSVNYIALLGEKDCRAPLLGVIVRFTLVRQAHYRGDGTRHKFLESSGTLRQDTDSVMSNCSGSSWRSGAQAPYRSRLGWSAGALDHVLSPHTGSFHLYITGECFALPFSTKSSHFATALPLLLSPSFLSQNVPQTLVRGCVFWVPHFGENVEVYN